MTIRTLSDVLADLKGILQGDQISMSALLEALHERGFGIALLLFSLPVCLPIPKPPGLSTLFGVPLFLLTIQQALGRHTLWMPRFVLRQSISRAKLEKMIDLSLPAVRKVEILIKPRLEWITQGYFSHMIGALGAMMSAFISLPLPGSNMVPAIGIALMSSGVMMRDGLTVILGAVIGTVWVFGLGSLYLFFGLEGFHALQTMLF